MSAAAIPLGAVAGGTVGAIAGMMYNLIVGKKKAAKKKDGDAAAPPAPAPTPADPEETKDTKDRPPKKHNVLDVPTEHMTRQTPMIGPLTQFRQRLQFQPEIEEFGNMIENLDHMHGIYKMVNGHTAVPKNADAVLFAQVAANRVSEQLDTIIRFNHKVRPSKLKKGEMTRFASEVKEMSKKLITRMHRQLAAKPYYGETTS